MKTLQNIGPKFLLPAFPFYQIPVPIEFQGLSLVNSAVGSLQLFYQLP